MQGNLAGLALVIALGAVAVSTYAVLQEQPSGVATDERLEALAEQVARLERSLQQARRAEPEQPSLLGLRHSTGSPAATPRAALAGEGPAGGVPESVGATVASGEPSPAEAERIKALVDVAVEKKAAQLQSMRQKKPTIGVFARTLDLSDEQRKAVEEGVVRSQNELREIFNTPSEDGTIFLDEFVELMAEGQAHPGRDKGAGKRLFARILSEKIPGTDETYAARAEAVKQRLRADFQRSWRPAQYATFEAWKMDPTDIKGLEGSPWKELEARVVSRARQLGAKIPQER